MKGIVFADPFLWDHLTLLVLTVQVRVVLLVLENKRFVSSQSASVVPVSSLRIHPESVVVALRDVASVVVALLIVAAIVSEGAVAPGAIQPQVPLVSRPHHDGVSILDVTALSDLSEIDLELLLRAAAEESATRLLVAVSFYGTLNGLVVIIEEVQCDDIA